MRKTEYHAIGCNENHSLNTTCKENSGYHEPEELDIISRLQLQAAATNWSNGGSRVANLLCDAERVIEGLRTQLDTVRSTIEFAKEQGALNEVTYDVLIKAATSVLCASGSHEPSVHNDSLIERATTHLNRVDYEGESYAVISQLIRALKAKTKATDGLVTIFGGHLYGTQQEKDAYKKWYFARLHDGVHPECKSYFVKVVPGDMLSSLILVCACGEETDITDYSNV